VIVVLLNVKKGLTSVSESNVKDLKRGQEGLVFFPKSALQLVHCHC
jgi:hypothetical protein